MPQLVVLRKELVNLKIQKPKKLLNKVRHAPYSNRYGLFNEIVFFHSKIFAGARYQ